MIWMDVDTALSEVPVNVAPLTDDTDFKTIETGVAYNAAGMALYWHFVTSAGAYTATAVTPTTAGDYDWAHQQQGMYTIEIPASGGASINNDTEGYGWFTGYATGVLPWRGPTIGFRAAAINDSLCDTNTTGLLAPTTAGRTLDVTATGEAGIDWANVGSPTTTLNLSGTTIKTATDVETDTADIQSRIGTPSDLGGGASLAANNTDMAGATFSSTTDSQEALRNRGDSAWITATGFSTHSAADVWSVATRVLTANTNLNDPTAAAIADAVWDEALSGHLSAGSTGEALNAAGAAGDPWTTSLPGAYGAGSAGYIIGNNINAPIATVDTVVDAIKAVTDLLPDAGALSSLATASALATVDTVVDAIKVVTDALPDSGALTTITNNVAAILADTGTDGVVVASASKAGYTLSATGSAALTEGYAALGAAATLPQLLYEVRALLAEKSISSTTLTTKKLDGSTTAATYTLDDATTPSAITRAT